MISKHKGDLGRSQVYLSNEQTPIYNSLARELGFSSHSHFTDAFRREFGRTPSEVRRDANRRTLREMSKNLEV